MASDTQVGQGLLDEYLAFLERHRGLREATLYYHRRWGRQFLRHLATHLPHGDIGRLTIPIVDEFVHRLVRRVGRGTQSQLLQVVRGLLRHLHRTGRLAHDWSTCIQGPRRYRLATVPTTISREQVKQLLRSVDRRTAIGRRHYAMVLLLAVYGLRAREVVELRLDDVDWRARVLRIQRSKTGHPLVLPLTAAVAEALVAYLRQGRPHTEAREIFVRHDGAAVAFRKSSRLYAVVRHAFDQAHIDSVRRGPHVLRLALRPLPSIMRAQGRRARHRPDDNAAPDEGHQSIGPAPRHAGRV